MRSASRDSLVRLIEGEFGSVTAGDGIHFREAKLIDRHHQPFADRRLARELDPELHWQDVPDSVISESYSVLSFVDEAGFLFCLPAVLRFVLVRDGEGCGQVANHCLMSLVPGGTRTIDRVVRSMSPGQRQAVASFLQYVVSAGDEEFLMASSAHEALASGVFGNAS